MNWARRNASPAFFVRRHAPLNAFILWPKTIPAHPQSASVSTSVMPRSTTLTMVAVFSVATVWRPVPKTQLPTDITLSCQSRNYRVAYSDEDVDSEYKEV